MTYASIGISKYPGGCMDSLFRCVLGCPPDVDAKLLKHLPTTTINKVSFFHGNNTGKNHPQPSLLKPPPNSVPLQYLLYGMMSMDDERKIGTVGETGKFVEHHNSHTIHLHLCFVVSTFTDMLNNIKKYNDDIQDLLDGADYVSVDQPLSLKSSLSPQVVTPKLTKQLAPQTSPFELPSLPPSMKPQVAVLPEPVYIWGEEHFNVTFGE